MTIYETIKAAISVKQAAEHYGLKVNRNGMACCPCQIFDIIKHLAGFHKTVIQGIVRCFRSGSAGA